LLKSWRALDAVLNADEGSTSLSEMGWRGSSLRSYFAEKISGLSGEPKQLGEWAAKRAQQLGNPNARRVISRQMTQLIDFCPGRYDSSPLTIIANGYVDLKGDRVGPDTPGYSDNYKRCNKMQPQPEFTLWFRYSSGRLEYERYRYDGPGSGEIANTKTGIPLPYVIYFDASGVVYGDVDEDTASVKLEPNPWVMCGLVPARQ